MRLRWLGEEATTPAPAPEDELADADIEFYLGRMDNLYAVYAATLKDSGVSATVVDPKELERIFAGWMPEVLRNHPKIKAKAQELIKKAQNAATALVNQQAAPKEPLPQQGPVEEVTIEVPWNLMQPNDPGAGAPGAPDAPEAQDFAPADPTTRPDGPPWWVVALGVTGAGLVLGTLIRRGRRK